MRFSDRANRIFIPGLLILMIVLMVSGSFMLFRFFGHMAVSDMYRTADRIESTVLRTAAREIRQYSLLLQALRNVPSGSVRTIPETEKQLEVLYDLYGPEGRIPYLISSVGYAGGEEESIRIFSGTVWEENPFPPEADMRERLFPGESEILQLRDGQGDLHCYLRFLPEQEGTRHLYMELDISGFHRNYMIPSLEEVLSDFALEWIEHNRRTEERPFGGPEGYRFRPLRAILGLPDRETGKLIVPVPYLLDGRKHFADMERGYKPDPDGRGDRIPAAPEDSPGIDRIMDIRYALLIGSEEAPFYEKTEKDLARNWLLSQLILTGLAAALLILALQLRRLRKLRLQERDFVASMTHELRTPLTVIQSAADNLSTGIVPSGRVKEYGTLVKDQVVRLGTMIEEILTFSSLENRPPVRPEPVPTNLRKLMEDLKQTLTAAAANKGAVLHWDTDALPEQCAGEPGIIRLLLENLILNALRHAYGESAGPVRVIGRIRIPDTLVFTVEDDGRGLPAGEQRRVFEPFYRDRISRQNQITGSGLGLFIARRKARMAGGDLLLESPYRRVDGRKLPGCRFTLTLPCKERP